MQATTKLKKSALWLAPAAIAVVAVVGCGSAAEKTETISHAVPARPDVIDRVASQAPKLSNDLPASADAAEAWMLPSDRLPVSGADPRWVFFRG